MTSKDLQRMDRLIQYTQETGLSAGLAKAERDADKIETLSKCEARAAILENRGMARLADPFRARAAFLRANGVWS
jgi:hypothetical protein